jgi:hypothetical protein
MTPQVGKTFCFDQKANRMKAWDGRRWLSLPLGEPYYVDDFGAAGDGTIDDAPAIQAAINQARTSGGRGGRLTFGCKRYRLAAALDLTNTAGVTLDGCGPQQTEIAPNMTTPGVTTLLGQTGGVMLDTTGSAFITLRHLQFRVLNSYTTPSTIGILMGRSASIPSAQFHSYDNVRVYMESDTSVNAPLKGRIGIYNVAAEHWSTDRLTVVADRPLIMTTSNVITGFVSPFQGALQASTMTMVQHRMAAFTVHAASLHPPVEMWNASQITFLDSYWSSLRGRGPAMAINGSGRLIYMSGEIEELTNVLHLNASVSELTLTQLQLAPGGSAPTSWVTFGSPALAITHSHIHVRQEGGARQTVFQNVSSATITDSIIYLGTSSGITGPRINASILIADEVTESSVSAAAGSAYLLLGPGGTIVNGLTVNSAGRISRYASASPVDGQLFIGGTSTGNFTAATLTPDVGTHVVNGSNSITVQTSAYSAAGKKTTNVHVVQDSATMESGVVTVTLTGSAAFSSVTSYTCVANDQTADRAIKVTQTSGSSITFTGTGRAVVRFICVGS